jgi:hypothetical protein
MDGNYRRSPARVPLQSPKQLRRDPTGDYLEPPRHLDGKRRRPTSTRFTSDTGALRIEWDAKTVSEEPRVFFADVRAQDLDWRIPSQRLR